jgi:hypothetical protein
MQGCFQGSGKHYEHLICSFSMQIMSFHLFGLHPCRQLVALTSSHQNTRSFELTLVHISKVGKGKQANKSGIHRTQHSMLVMQTVQLQSADILTHTYVCHQFIYA